MPDRSHDADMGFLKLHRPTNPGCRNEDNEETGMRSQKSI
jgi:hypothetical protein